MQNHWQTQKWGQDIGEEEDQHGHQLLLGACHKELLSGPRSDKGQRRQGRRQDILTRAVMTRELPAASWAVDRADNVRVFPASPFLCKIDFLLIIQLLFILEHQCFPCWFTIDQGAHSLPNLVFSSSSASNLYLYAAEEKHLKNLPRVLLVFLACFAFSPGNKRVVKSNVYNNLTDYLLIRY